ncbi:unnamed protein product [Rhizophagus irregularis]|nr:unnamed protein product [Rhizophagus irregularis]
MGYGTDNYSRLTTQKQHNFRSFSEVVYGDLPQFPRIHVEFGSLNRLPGTKIVSLLKQILDGMLEMFRNRYSGIMNVPNSPNDVVAWTSSTCPKESLHKKISRFSQFLGTNVNIHKNELFVKKFLVLDRIVHPSSSIADSNTKNSCAINDAISYRENDLAIQQRASSFVEQELRTENFYGDKQTDIIHFWDNGINRQHNGSAKTGKKRWSEKQQLLGNVGSFHNNPYIRSRNGVWRKNDVTNWVENVSFATALVRSVICMQSTSRALPSFH